MPEEKNDISCEAITEKVRHFVYELGYRVKDISIHYDEYSYPEIRIIIEKSK